jgi:hypothetical protein
MQLESYISWHRVPIEVQTDCLVSAGILPERESVAMDIHDVIHRREIMVNAPDELVNAFNPCVAIRPLIIRNPTTEMLRERGGAN